MAAPTLRSEAAGGMRAAMARPLAALSGYLYRVPASVPWWSARTLVAILRSALLGRVVDGPDTARLAQRLAGVLGAPVLPAGSGRAAIELALRAGGVGPGAEVVVPTFCCESVLLPVLAVGARPVLADIGPELTLTAETVLAALGPATRAVIVPHLFGNPAPIDTIADLARQYQILMLDDAAQALGGGLDGRPLGTFGDVGVVSFGNGKICFGTGGGALVSRRPDLLARAAAIPLARGSAREGLRNALAVAVRRRARGWTLPVLMALARLGWTPLRPVVPRGGHALRNIDAAVALTLVETLGENIQARRQRVAGYRELLAGVSGLHLIPHRAGSACLAQVVRVTRHGRTARTVIDALRADRIEAGASFTPLHLLARYAELASGPLPGAETAWEALLELPAEPSVSMAEIGRVAHIVARATA